MRRPVRAEHDAALALARTLRLAPCQPGHLRAQPRDLAILPGDNLREVIDRADEMGQSFLDLTHAPRLRGASAPVKLAPPRPLV